MGIKGKFKSEYKIFRKEVTWVEYTLWWAARILMLYAVVKAKKDGYDDSLVLQLTSKFTLAFFLPALHLLPRKIFLARISYRVQDIAVFMLAITAFFGQFKGYYSKVEWFDAFLHTFGCFACVFAGYELTMALKRDKLPLIPVVAAMCGFGFSFFFAVGWEIFEFTSDTIMVGSNSQNWMIENSSQMISLFKNIDPKRLPLLDTMTDLIFGTVGSIFGGFALSFYVHFHNKVTGLTLVNKTIAADKE